MDRMSESTATGLKPVFRPLPAAALDHMERQRCFVAELVEARLPEARLSGTVADFALLQRILDEQWLEKSQTWELQSLGIVFGDALVQFVPGLQWLEVTDAYGTDPVMVFRDTTLQFNPLTMLSKRVEHDESTDVSELAVMIRDYVGREGELVDKREG
jgi:hypothetical protein